MTEQIHQQKKRSRKPLEEIPPIEPVDNTESQEISEEASKMITKISLEVDRER